MPLMPDISTDVGKAVLRVSEFDDAAFLIRFSRYFADNLNCVVSKMGHPRDALIDSLDAETIHILDVDLYRRLRLDFAAFIHKRNVEEARLIQTHRLNSLNNVRIQTAP